MTWFKDNRYVATLLTSGLALAGCSSSQAPAQQLAASESAVRAANELGAKATPEAALHLKMAKDRLEKAKAMNAKGEGETATRLFEEAKADAELAVVLTREQQAKSEAREAQHKLHQASQEADKPAQ